MSKVDIFSHKVWYKLKLSESFWLINRHVHYVKCMTQLHNAIVLFYPLMDYEYFSIMMIGREKSEEQGNDRRKEGKER